MNYRAINRNCPKRGQVHETKRFRSFHLVPVFITLCGHPIENGIYTKWVETEESVNCKYCLKVKRARKDGE